MRAAANESSLSCNARCIWASYRASLPTLVFAVESWRRGLGAGPAGAGAGAGAAGADRDCAACCAAFFRPFLPRERGIVRPAVLVICLSRAASFCDQ